MQSIDTAGVVHAPSGTQQFRGPAGISVSWDAGSERTSVRCAFVSQNPNGERTVDLDEEQPTGWFEIGDEPNRIEGELTLVLAGGQAFLDGDFSTGPSTAFQGRIAMWSVSADDADTPAGAGVSIRSLRPCGELFPFLWVRAPSATDDDGTRFLRWAEPQSFPSDPDALAGARAYVDSAAYLAAPTDVVNAASVLLRVADAAFEEAPEDPVETIEAVLDAPLARYLRTTESRELETRLWWQLAADALLGPRRIDTTRLVLRAIRARAYVAALADGTDGADRIAHAIPVLPASLVLRPADPPPPSKDGWVQVLGVGVLEVVERRLVGYELGDIAHTVNVMPFESRVDRFSESKRIGVQETESERDDRTDETAQEVAGEADLDDEIHDVLGGRTICRDYTGITPNTGPAGFCVSLSGKWNGSDCLKERSRRHAARFAQRITDRAAKRLKARSVAARTRQLEQSSVRSLTRRIDNRNRDTRNVGVFRWLEKVYALSLRDRGLRLLTELMIDHPARALVKSIASADPRPLVEPVAPSALTPPIDDPTKVLADNYRSLATRYGARDIPAPPRQNAVASYRVDGREAARPGFLEIPEGYAATGGLVTYALVDGTFPLVGLVGEETITTKVGAAPAAVAIATSGDGCDCPDPMTPPTPPSPAVGTSKLASVAPSTGRVPVAFGSASPGFSVSVDVDCTLDDYTDLFAAWQEDAYARIVAAYEARHAEYVEALDARIARRTADDRGRTIERALTSLGMEILRAKSSGDDASELYRFFDAAFEWSTMAFDFKPWPAGLAPTTSECCFAGEANLDRDDPRTFASFLAARSARVLLPVRPGFELAVLYFLASGKRWIPCPPDIPIDEASVAVVAELVAADARPPAGVGPSWRVTVPTTLTVLQDSEALPGGGD